MAREPTPRDEAIRGPAGAPEVEAAAGPTPEQALLLRAALCRGPESMGAWDRWRARTRLDGLDRDSQWLLPLLYHNLHAQGVAPALLGRYRSVYLHNWYKNSLTLRRAEPAVGALQGAGQTVILLGGAALALRHYEALGARPFERLGVLARGPAAPGPSPAAGDAVERRASLLDRGADDDLLRGATEVRWKTLRGLVLDPAAQLVDICAGRRAWDSRSGLLWMADAATLVRRSPDLAWTRVFTLAERLGRQSDVAGALRHLRRHLGLDLPGAGPAALDPAAEEVAG